MPLFNVLAIEESRVPAKEGRIHQDGGAGFSNLTLAFGMGQNYRWVYPIDLTASTVIGSTGGTGGQRPSHSRKSPSSDTQVRNKKEVEKSWGLRLIIMILAEK